MLKIEKEEHVLKNGKTAVIEYCTSSRPESGIMFDATIDGQEIGKEYDGEMYDLCNKIGMRVFSEKFPELMKGMSTDRAVNILRDVDEQP